MKVEVIDRIESLVPAQVLKIGDKDFTTKKIYEIPVEQVPVAEHMKVFSLSSIVDYANANPDTLAAKEQILNVISHDQVVLCSKLNANKRREIFINADVKNSMSLNQYLNIDDFILMLQSSFKAEKVQQSILKLASKITDEDVKTNHDDGITQSVTIKSGIQRLENADIPNPVRLIPYRTFPEIEQPEGLFIFRVQRGKTGPELGLFDCDSNEWKLRTITAIKDYLKKNQKTLVI